MSTSPLPPDPYEALGVLKDADADVIKKAHRKLVLQYHPDRITDPSLKDENMEKFHKVQQAYELLIDPVSRRRYDDSIVLAKFREQQNLEKASLRKKDNGRNQIEREKKSRRRVYATVERRPGDEDIQRAKSRRQEKDKRSPRTWTALSDYPGQGKSKYEGSKGFINGLSVLALADTGADANFVAQHIANFSNMHVVTRYPNNRGPKFLMAHGKVVRPMAKACATWVFAEDGAGEYQLEFFVLKDCIFDIMLGAEFVYSIGLLSFNQHLLTQLARPPNAVHIRVVKTCGRPQQKRLKGDIWHTRDSRRNEPCLALPDSAAEPNIVSYNYAKKRSWLLHMEPNPPNCKLLQFADGSLEETEGRLLLYWKFRNYFNIAKPARTFVESHFRAEDRMNGEQKRPEPPRSTWSGDSDRPMRSHYEGPFVFDVLRGCPWDVIVGQEFLDSTAAFTARAHCFTAADYGEPLGLNPVLRVPNRCVPNPSQIDPESKLLAELTARRLQEDEEKKKKRKARYTIPAPQPVVSPSDSTTTVNTGNSTVGTVPGGHFFP